MSRLARRGAAALAIAVLVAGCSGSEATSDPVEAAPPPTTEPTTTTASTLPPGPTTTTTAPAEPIDPPPPVPDPEFGATSNSVFVVGDSVTLGTTAAIPAALPAWLVTYDAEGSRRLAQAIDLFAARRADIGQAVVVHLGNNFIAGERGTYGEQIDEAMAVLGDVPVVVWTTVSPVTDTRREINDEILAAADRWANLRVADWGALVAADPALSWDGIHLTPAGRLRFAALVAEVLGPPPSP